MNQLSELRVNTIYAQNKEGQKPDMVAFHEIVMLVDKANYIRNNEGQVIRERGISEQRVIIAQDSLPGVIEWFKSLYENTDKISSDED